MMESIPGDSCPKELIWTGLFVSSLKYKCCKKSFGEFVPPSSLITCVIIRTEEIFNGPFDGLI